MPDEAERYGITTRVSVIDGGHAAEAIVQAAERLGADVITLGSHGRSGIGQALLASVAADVVHRAHKPVLVVRPPPG